MHRRKSLMVVRSVNAKRTAVYTRVSTSKQQEDGTSLDTQEQRCRAHAAELGYTVVETLVVREVYSGAELFDRAGLNRIREAIRRREVDAVVVFAIDRLSRDQNHRAVAFAEAEYHDVHLEFVTEKLDDTPEGRLLASVSSYVAAIEREKIRERTIRGKRAKAEAGRVPASGLDLYGYVKDRERGIRTIRDDEAVVVRRIFQEAAGGRPIRDIVRRLNADGIPAPGAKVPGGSGRLWTSSVHRVLQEPTYKGEAAAFRYKTVTRRGKRKRHVERAPREEWIALPDGVTPALVDAATWEAVQQRRATNHGATTRNQERPRLLRGVVRCARCGVPMLVEISKGYVYYRCGSRYRIAGSCGAPLVRADKLEAWSWEQITAVLEHPEIVQGELERIGSAGPDPALTVEREAAASALAKADSQAQRLMALYTASDEAS